MLKTVVVWMVCVIVLLTGTIATANDFTIIPENKGDIVVRDGNNVTDEFIESDLACAMELDEYRSGSKDDPIKDVKRFTDGVLWGAIGSMVLMLLL